MSDEREEKPTVAIQRDILLGLVAESTPARPHVHTVRRNELAAGTFDDVRIDGEHEGVSPTLVLGVILLLVVVFVVVVQLS